LQLWSQFNFGEDLIFGPRGGGVYYWDASAGVTVRGVNLTVSGDADTPLFQNHLLVSDASRFVIVFGTNDYGASTIDPMLIRWSEQEDPFTWTPAITNQAGSVRLSHGSKIVTAIQTRQEIVTFTDQALYSLQYLGPPFVWGTQLLGDNISIMGPSAVALASGVVYWMGVDKFYMYDGRVQTLNCDLRRYVFEDFNQDQAAQVFSGTNEGFNEVWWFYCSAGSTVVDKYVIYNYLEKIWYYGTLGRTAWLDTGLQPYPIAATYINNIVNHESGVDDWGRPQFWVCLAGAPGLDVWRVRSFPHAAGHDDAAGAHKLGLGGHSVCWPERNQGQHLRDHRGVHRADLHPRAWTPDDLQDRLKPSGHDVAAWCTPD
jgi:hypothetical protein